MGATRKRILFIYDHYLERPSDWWLTDAFKDEYIVEAIGFRRELPVDSYIKYRQLRAYLEYLRQAFYVVSKRKRYAAFVFWDPGSGVLTGALLRLLGLSCGKIVLCHPFYAYRKSGLRRVDDVIRRFGLKKVAVVGLTSRGLTKDYREYFGYDGRLDFLPDPVRFEDVKEVCRGDYIFIGGRSLRDWGVLARAAEQVREEKFVICTSDPSVKNISFPDNVAIKFAVSYDEFYKVCAGCKFIVLPLVDAQSPTGLLVLVNGLNCGKPIIVTQTLVTADYVRDGETGLLARVGDSDDLAEKIQKLSDDPELVERMGDSARASARQFTREAYCQKVCQILSEILVECGSGV